jgi:hypothetical protein
VPEPGEGGPTVVFEVEGDTFLPTVLANGPWAEGALHGGPTAALLAHLCERQPPLAGGVELRVQRLAVDLLRPVPRAPLRATVRHARPGRKVDWVDASLWAGDVEVARASALRTARRPLDIPAGIDPWARGGPGDPAFAPPPDQPSVPLRPRPVSGFHNLGAELRFVRSGFEQTGPGQAWIRVRHPIIAGIATTPTMRAVACADFVNAVGKALPMDTHSYINPDLVVALWREPADGWIGLDAVTRFDPDGGHGLAEATLVDAHGPFGRAQQSVLVEAR